MAGNAAKRSQYSGMAGNGTAVNAAIVQACIGSVTKRLNRTGRNRIESLGGECSVSAA